MDTHQNFHAIGHHFGHQGAVDAVRGNTVRPGVVHDALESIAYLLFVA